VAALSRVTFESAGLSSSKCVTDADRSNADIISVRYVCEYRLCPGNVPQYEPDGGSQLRDTSQA